MVGNEWSGRHKQGKFIDPTGITSPLALEAIKQFEAAGGNVLRNVKDVDPYKDFPFYRANAAKHAKKEEK